MRTALIREWEGLPPGSRNGASFDADLAHYVHLNAKNGHVTICAAQDGRELAQLSGPDKLGFSLTGGAVFSPGGHGLAIHDSRGHLQVWDWRLRVCLFETTFPIAEGAVSFSLDGRHVTIGTFDGTVVTYEVATSKEVRRLRGLAQPAALAFHPDGSKLAVASLKSNDVAIYDMATGKVIQKLLGHPSGVWHVAWHSKGYLLATASGDNAYLWDAATGQQHATLQGHQASVVRVAFLPPGDLVMSNSWDGTTRL